MVHLSLAFSLFALVVGLATTPRPISPSTATISWTPNSETTSVWIYEPINSSVLLEFQVNGGVSNTVQVPAHEGVWFQVQEYKTVDGHLVQTTFFNTFVTPAFIPPRVYIPLVT